MASSLESQALPASIWLCLASAHCHSFTPWVHMFFDALRDLEELLLADWKDFGIRALKNAQKNVAWPYKSLFSLQGKFAGVPAIVVGGGPSLQKNKHLLDSMRERALIFAGGSALHMISPHVAGAIDPETAALGGAPLCFTPRAEPCGRIDPNRFLAPDPHFAFLNHILGQEPFDSGWTVGNFLTKVAHLFGCSPIVLVGMDYAYEKGKKYAFSETETEEETVWHLNAKGDRFETRPDWIQAVQWTEALAHETTILNATEGGFGFREPVVEVKLQDLQFQEQQDLEQRLHSALQSAPVLFGRADWEGWKKALLATQNALKEGSRVEDGVVFETLLKPLWRAFGPIFEKAAPDQRMDLHEKIFFERVIEEHLAALQETGLEGTIQLFWPNGKLKRKCSFERGVRVGLDQMWDEVGTLVDEGHYEKGKPTGVHRRWNREGALIEEVNYGK